MKKIVLMICLCASIAACKKNSDFLDSKADTGETEASVFSDSLKSIRFLTQIYSSSSYSFAKGRFSSHGNTEMATDDAEYAYSGPTQNAVIMYNGTLSPTNFWSGGSLPDFWTTPYANIRRVNLMLSKLPVIPLSEAKKKRITGELKFLRAWYYHLLLINFGGIPLEGDNVYGITDVIDLPRSSFDESVNYITAELDAAANILPITTDYAEQDYGRATKGACLALKSRVLLYAASPLFNGGAITQASAAVKPIVSYPSYSVARWQKAADAAETLINTGTYSLFEDNVTAPGYGFYNVFLKRVNSEYIFSFNRPSNRDFEGYYNPPSRGGAKNSTPTQQLATAFPMKNGKAITDPTSGYDAANPYTNRDPRFGYSIIYNQSLYYSTTTSTKIVVNTYNGAATDGYTSNGTGPTTTGYYARKMCDENISSNSSFNTERGWPLIRYAEILLNYAEAINETGQTALAYPKLLAIRKRAGITAGADNLYGLKANMSVDEMRTVIQNERRIELMNEDHRWNDIRRWKIAVDVNNGFNKAINITKTGNVYTYQVVNTIRQHVFNPQHYLMPIPQSEVSKMPSMLQNPGY
ncbi:RagB/SusD family nutrient uptake outer membrane protein [Pedobacter sp. ISL-68]|uniref:RagB/SusD family nutrient uptake outer membrane protein n=1 Tax=unclassified Pedobacter TaxID=2628915 RepID=UPI001BE6F995|nr:MULTISPECIES: RagB/SusD family nutrient uptake outer membrane protein [unclassified Pedobacter]MBT2561793.1 RagB/SusD family nutrient uptake outer membrane protein [Pedobacter sp. ISL-64]MBT2591181.1 RagB/SusD family nutrient uptake outer membrane protein [Pedobacter sp. ISL-68]